MKNNKIRYLTISALFAAVIFVATAYLPRFPVASTGYVHIGDLFIYISACILPLPYAACAAAIGGMLADVMTGFVQYAVFSFVIKALLCVSFTNKNEKLLCAKNVIACLICLVITTGGYFFADWILYGFAAAIGVILYNLLQAVVSGFAFILIAGLLDRIKIKRILKL